MIFAMSIITKLTLTPTLNDPHDYEKVLQASASRSWVDENNDGVSKRWFAFNPRIATKITFAAEFSAPEDLYFLKAS